MMASPNPIEMPTSPSTVPMIEFSDVTKRYHGGLPVIERMSLTVAKGEFVTLIGPSGCGKSTVLKLISGLTPATSGTIRVDRMTPKNAREIMAYIFQDATLLPWRTVRENVGLGLELEGESKGRREKKTAALLEMVKLENVADAYPRELSGGMKMRVSIARALARSPQVLLMDEPFAALDEMSRDRLNEELLRLRAEQKWTGVFVTHSVAEAVFLSTQIVVLAANPGRVHAVIPVPFSFPRSADLRDTLAFDERVIEVSHALRGALAQ
jgi:NitT/TauT family transport system ATP-binding protein